MAIHNLKICLFRRLRSLSCVGSFLLAHLHIFQATISTNILWGSFTLMGWIHPNGEDLDRTFCTVVSLGTTDQLRGPQSTGRGAIGMRLGANSPATEEAVGGGPMFEYYGYQGNQRGELKKRFQHDLMKQSNSLTSSLEIGAGSE